MQATPARKTVDGAPFEHRFAHLCEGGAKALDRQWQRVGQARPAARASSTSAIWNREWLAFAMDQIGMTAAEKHA